MWHDGRIYFTEMGADRVSHHRERQHARVLAAAGLRTDPDRAVRADGLRGRLPSRPRHGRGLGRGRDRTPLHNQPGWAAPAGSQRRGERRAGRGVFLRCRAVRSQRALDRARLSPQRHGRDDRSGGRDPLRQRRQLRSGEPHALCIRASGAAGACVDARQPRAGYGAKGADRLPQQDAGGRQYSYPLAGPTASRCGPDCWRWRNTARAGCICSTATAGT